MKPLLIIAAMPVETAVLETSLAHRRGLECGGFACVEGTLGGLRTVVCSAGVGKVNAAAASAVMIERFSPGLVINTGCAGAYIGSGLSVGDLVAASEEVLADDGVIVEEGWKDLRFMELPYFEGGGGQSYNIITLSAHAADKAIQLADASGISLTAGRFATVSTCSGTARRGEEMAKRWNVIAENMEGAAVAHICLRYGVDCLEIRGISNLVDERDMKKWEIRRAAEAAQKFVLAYCEQFDRAPLSQLR